MKNSMHRTPAALALVALACLAAPASAQLSVGVGGGLSGVTGDIANGVNPGYHATATIDFGFPLLPVGLRADASYHKFDAKDGFNDIRIVAATANVTYNLLPLPLIKPYVMGGVGSYNAKAEGEGNDAISRIGFNAGAGVRFDLLGFGAFAEGRFHHVPEKDGEFVTTQFYPITLGIRF